MRPGNSIPSVHSTAVVDLPVAVGWLAALVACLLATAAWGADAARPNIVVILADDMGYSDIGCFGGEIATPHLDRLAADGLRLTHFYNNARCCPTRASLLTGLYPHQAGVGHMVTNLGPSEYQGFLNDRCVTIAEVLAPAGYECLMVGKWHVGGARPHWPRDRGFQRYFGLLDGASNYFRLDPERRMADDDELYHPPTESFYMTEAFTNRAVEYLDKHGRGKKPFFLYLAYTAPHWPLHALPEDIAKYRGKYRQGWDRLRTERHARQAKLGIVDPKWTLAPRDPAAREWSQLSAAEQDGLDLRMAVYAAQIDRLDQGVGRVLAKLKEIGAEENTLVMFLADNGGCAERVERGAKEAAIGAADSFASYGVGWSNASNTPFRLHKHWTHEGGIATPFITRWPQGINRRGAISTEPGHLIDILPTCVDVGGAEYPRMRGGRPVAPLEGKSLAPLFSAASRPGHERLFWEHEGNRAVRQGDWKLVARHKGPWELYNLRGDRTETRDLAAAEPDRVRALSAAYDAWAKRVGAAAWPIKRP